MKQKRHTTSSKECKICRASDGKETFHYMEKEYICDVTQARAFVQNGRDPFEIDDDDVFFSLKKCHVSMAHTRHVDTSIPGIVAIVIFRNDDGQGVSGHRLIDGHHRAARCLELGISFHLYLLSEQESVDVLIKSPYTLEPEPASA